MASKVLVTGADGFIGSHLAERLIRDGHNVKAMVMYNSFNSWGWLDTSDKQISSAMEVTAGDIRDPQFVRAAVRGCDAVLHLAALISIPYSYEAADAYVDTNVRGTLNVLHACKEFGVSRLVHTSTSEVYGSAQYVPIDEKHPLNAQSPYAASKIGADQMALSFHASFDVPVLVLRPFNTYGPRQSARAVIPAIISQLAAGKRDLELGALHPTRDFNYVSDTVGGFVAALKASSVRGEVINVGSGFEISIGDLATMIADVMGVQINLVQKADRVRPDASEVQRLNASNEKARTLLGWQPEFSGAAGLRRGLEETAKWFRNPENLRQYKTDRYNV